MDDVRVFKDARFRPLDGNGGLKPRRQLQPGDLLPHPPDDVLGGRRAGRDDLGGERFGDDGMGDGDDRRIDFHLFRGAPLQPADGQTLGGNETLGQLGAQGPDQGGLVRGRKPVAEGEDVGLVDADPFGVSFSDDLGQALPLADFIRVPDRLIETADPVTADRELLDPVLSPDRKKQACSGAGPIGSRKGRARDRPGLPRIPGR